MRRRTGLLFVLLVMTLFASGCAGSVSAQQGDREERDLNEPVGPTLEEYANAIRELKSHEIVLGIYGDLPEFKDAHDRRAWYDRLDDFHDETFDSIARPRLYPDGPVIGYGYDVEGYLDVGIPDTMPEEHLEDTMDALYRLIDEEGREMGFDAIPVKFRSVDPDSLVLHTVVLEHPQDRSSIEGIRIQALVGMDILGIRDLISECTISER
ncbi:hypothetical protein E2N92_12060 [Methanofollis formosanus]|uniref:Uncharacterized protein n=1 Tax=Methanofollis formosanus TaxID=299308 RepID=A0A8G1A3K8_9EURY|nr:hypothetical protein [Methanofollis formosanus]QYZ80108.1 hypothetical protein E2N92_12060 [Methanofollis formosanus]